MVSCTTYQVAVLESHELFSALVLVDRVVIGNDAFTVDGGLLFISSVLTMHHQNGQSTRELPLQSIARRPWPSAGWDVSEVSRALLFLSFFS